MKRWERLKRSNCWCTVDRRGNRSHAVVTRHTILPVKCWPSNCGATIEESLLCFVRTLWELVVFEDLRAALQWDKKQHHQPRSGRGRRLIVGCSWSSFFGNPDTRHWMIRSIWNVIHWYCVLSRSICPICPICPMVGVSLASIPWGIEGEHVGSTRFHEILCQNSGACSR